LQGLGLYLQGWLFLGLRVGKRDLVRAFGGFWPDLTAGIHSNKSTVFHQRDLIHEPYCCPPALYRQWTHRRLLEGVVEWFLGVFKEVAGAVMVIESAVLLCGAGTFGEVAAIKDLMATGRSAGTSHF
jgi:hypothetical protein